MSDTRRGHVLIQFNIVFEKPDHSMGIIKERNVSSDPRIWTVYYYGEKTDHSRGVNKEKNVFEQYNYYGDVL